MADHRKINWCSCFFFWFCGVAFCIDVLFFLAVDHSFEVVSKDLIDRKDAMFTNYRRLMAQDSMVGTVLCLHEYQEVSAVCVCLECCRVFLGSTRNCQPKQSAEFRQKCC